MTKLSPRQMHALRAIDDGDRYDGSVVRKQTFVSLWRNGLIEDNHNIIDGGSRGWVLTKHGQMALESGRLHLTRRRREERA